jgi:hypothetical protein
LARFRLIQQAIESIWFQQFKRLHSHISVKILLDLSEGAAQRAAQFSGLTLN